MAFMQVSEKRRSNMPTNFCRCNSYANPSIKLKLINAGTKRNASQDLTDHQPKTKRTCTRTTRKAFQEFGDHEAKTKRSCTRTKTKASQEVADHEAKTKCSCTSSLEFVVEKKSHSVPVALENPRKHKVKEVAIEPKQVIFSLETAKKASVSDLTYKAKVAKLGVGDVVTKTVDESGNLNKERLRKEQITKRRNVFRIALNKMKPQLFDDNFSVMAEFEKLIGLR